MKKFLALIFALIIVFSLFSCAKSDICGNEKSNKDKDVYREDNINSASGLLNASRFLCDYDKQNERKLMKKSLTLKLQ